MKVALKDALFTPAAVSDIKDCSTLAEATCWRWHCGAARKRWVLRCHESTWVSARCRSEMANIIGA